MTQRGTPRSGYQTNWSNTNNENIALPLKVGVGRAHAHHGEFLQGVFEGDDGRLYRGLVTLPLTSQESLATFWPDERDGIRTRPANRTKAARAAALTLEHIGIAGGGGELTIESPILIGHGYGSSTADVIASIRAVAAAAGVTLRQSTVARLAVTAEGASDAIAYSDQALLFAHREGRAIEHFGGEFPPLLVVGFRDGSGRPIDTLRMRRARYDSEEIGVFRVLRGLAYRSIKQQDPRLLGRVATMSALISQRHLPKASFSAVLDIARDHDACGVQVAHSGTLIGILLDAVAPGAAKRAAELAKKVGGVGFKGIHTFAVNAEARIIQ
ncbi:kinase [Mesorhizobium tianshanense]|uniref:Threonine kinase n=1 Tax=Mesorhizobium tianshanense TaxID=39844 RepID=A0A562N882_9HYPH|nr:kinase [Mesorhizobium tianshanense]TWI28412.1 threonine kinase [Mesorhizobium tianshanense]GLS36885.1 kinase [Mesorhizobium tianshanense]